MEASGGNPTGKRFGPWRSIIVHVSQLAQTHVQSTPVPATERLFSKAKDPERPAFRLPAPAPPHSC